MNMRGNIDCTTLNQFRLHRLHYTGNRLSHGRRKLVVNGGRERLAQERGGIFVAPLLFVRARWKTQKHCDVY